MTDEVYVRQVIQLAYERTDLSGAELAELLRAESDAYETDPRAAADPSRIVGDLTPAAGRTEPSTDHRTLDAFES